VTASWELGLAAERDAFRGALGGLGFADDGDLLRGRLPWRHPDGREIAQLELEELGEDDTLLDVVGIAAALDSLRVERIEVSPIPMPPPSADGSHGSPAPVTLELLSGFVLRPSVAGTELSETITPTAAAIFSALARTAPEIPEIESLADGAERHGRSPCEPAKSG